MSLTANLEIYINIFTWPHLQQKLQQHNTTSLRNSLEHTSICIQYIYLYLHVYISLIFIYSLHLFIFVFSWPLCCGCGASANLLLRSNLPKFTVYLIIAQCLHNFRQQTIFGPSIVQVSHTNNITLHTSMST